MVAMPSDFDPDEIEGIDELQDPIRHLLARDLREAAAALGIPEVRYLVSYYYDLQHYRIASSQQSLQLEKAGSAHGIIDWASSSMYSIEKTIAKTLDYYTRIEPTGMGAWSRGILGIGPVLSAGLLAHIDISKAPTVGHIWRFAGLDPTVTWERKQKRPWNAALKVLCYKIGESFIKVQNRPKDIYGHVYAAHRKLEDEKNLRGEFAPQAAAELAKKNYGKDTEAYKWYMKGMLPPAHLYARSRRYAVKLFLAHWFEEAYRRYHGAEPPKPYAIEHLGHVHQLTPDLLARMNRGKEES